MKPSTYRPKAQGFQISPGDGASHFGFANLVLCILLILCVLYLIDYTDPTTCRLWSVRL